MENIQKSLILELTKKLSILFGAKATKNIQINLKNDQSFVTEIDLFVSNFLKEQLSRHKEFSSYTFFSEEDFKEYSFPCAILDPIDGTRELVKGRPECAVSLALMQTDDLRDPKNYGWLYNPFSGFSISSDTPFVSSINKSTQKFLALVSRSEFHKGHYDKYLDIPILDISPRGSIAFKLGLLASGACDFIVTKEPKNVWDIAAGTILCSQRRINLYENGIRINHLDRAHYSGVLIWAPEEIAPMILDIFKEDFKNS